MIPILLDKTKSLASLVASKTGGIGELSGAYDGVAREEATGIKEAKFKLPVDSPRFSDLQVGSYIKIKDDGTHEPQIYEVYKITKPSKGIVTVRAQHISYILGKATVLPFTATGITLTCSSMLSHLVGTYPFTFQSDISNTTSTFTLDKPMSFRGAIGGWKGSILDIFGGELEWDNLKVRLLAHRGHDYGVTIEYGKNLTDLTHEESIDNVYNAVIGYAVMDETTYVGDIQKIVTTDSPKTLNVDFSSSFDMNNPPTVAELNRLARAYAVNNDIGVPKMNLKVSFELLANTEEYKDIAVLEQTNLFDVVHVSFPSLGVEAKAKIITVEYDFINERPISVELGNAKTDLLSLIDDEVEKGNEDSAQAVGFLDEYIASLTSVITNSLGLFYTKVPKANGGYQFYLHNRPVLAESQYQWTINAGGFALSQDYGQTWSAGIDSSGDAVFNSLSSNIINALNIYGSYIQGSQMVFGNPSQSGSEYIIVQPYTDGVTFDGTGAIRMQPQGEFNLRNIGSNNNTYNSMYMNHASTQNIVSMTNYGYSDSTKPTNSFTLGSYSSQSAITMVNYKMGSNLVANRVQLFSMSTAEQMVFTNYRLSADETANTFTMASVSNNSSIALQNFNSGGSTYGNYITMLVNDGGDNNLHIQNNDSSGTAKNYIDMSAANNMMHIWSRSDLYLQSDGAVRIYSGGSQDITLNSNDDLHLNYIDKLEINGTAMAFKSFTISGTTYRALCVA